jgi:citrate lyase subunit gamma (acyl carrier protein)
MAKGTRKNKKKKKKNCFFPLIIIKYPCMFSSAEKKGAFRMEIKQNASAGTLESSDALIEMEPSEGGLEIKIESVVKDQFGDEIERVAREVLEDCGVTSAKVRIADRGALECVLRARLETCIARGKGEV